MAGLHYSFAAMSTEERITDERRAKAGNLRAAGRNPYRNDFRPSHSCAEVRKRYEGTKPEEATPGIQPVDGEVIKLAGRVVARRGFGKTVFAPIRDATGDLQLFININELDETDWAEVLLFGKPYNTVYVNADGNITLDAPDAQGTESYEAHFSQPRISGLFDDLNPAQGGLVTWQQRNDRIVVTWLDVPEDDASEEDDVQA